MAKATRLSKMDSVPMREFCFGVVAGSTSTGLVIFTRGRFPLPVCSPVAVSAIGLSWLGAWGIGTSNLSRLGYLAGYGVGFGVVLGIW